METNFPSQIQFFLFYSWHKQEKTFSSDFKAPNSEPKILSNKNLIGNELEVHKWRQSR